MPWTPRPKKVKVSEETTPTQAWPSSDDDMEDLSEPSDDDQSSDDPADEILAAIDELRELLLQLLTKQSAASVN